APGAASGNAPRPPGDKKVFAVPALFSGVADRPENVYGDLCLIRKGGRSMMTGGGATTVEPITTREEWVSKAAALREIYQQVLGAAPPISEALSIRVEGEQDRGEILE